MLALRKVRQENDLGSEIGDAKVCVKQLFEKYSGADLTEDLAARIALEAYVRGRVSAKTHCPEDEEFHFAH